MLGTGKISYELICLLIKPSHYKSNEKQCLNHKEMRRIQICFIVLRGSATQPADPDPLHNFVGIHRNSASGINKASQIKLINSN